MKSEHDLLSDLGYNRQWSDGVILMVSYTYTKLIKVCVSVWERDEEKSHVWHPVYAAISKKGVVAEDSLAWKKVADFVCETVEHYLDNSMLLPTTVIICQHSDPKYGEINGAINVMLDNILDCTQFMFTDESTMLLGSRKWKAKWKLVGEHPICGQFNRSEAHEVMKAVKTIDLLFNEQ